MLRLYFLGGEDLQKRDSEEINRKALSDAGESPLVLVFPWSSKPHGREDRYRPLLVQYFKSLGARAVRFVEVSLPYSDMVKLVEEADIIYLPGGDTRLLLERLRNTGAAHLISTFNKVIIGNSAGALVLCGEFIQADEGGQSMSIASGLGLVDFSVSVHYNEAQDLHLTALSQKRHIFAIPEGAALFFTECCLNLIGPLVMFQDGKKA